MDVNDLIEKLKECNPNFEVEHCGDYPINVFSLVVVESKVILLDGKKAITVKELIKKLEDVANHELEVLFKDNWIIDEITNYNGKVQLQV